LILLPQQKKTHCSSFDLDLSLLVGTSRKITPVIFDYANGLGYHHRELGIFH